MPAPAPITTNLMPMGRNAAANQGLGATLPDMPPGAPPIAPQGPPAPAMPGMGAPPMVPQAPAQPQFEAVAQDDGSSLIMMGGKVVAFNPAPKLPKPATPQGIPIAMQPPMP